MPINKNHEFEDLDGVKCAIVEKNVSKERVAFLKTLLEFNRFEVVVVASPASKAVPAKPAAPAQAIVAPHVNVTTVPSTDATAAPANAPSPDITSSDATSPPPPPETFTVGVTDVTFNPINAIFGRLLKTPDGHVVTLAYWEERENVSKDEVPYFEEG